MAWYEMTSQVSSPEKGSQAKDIYRKYDMRAWGTGPTLIRLRTKGSDF